MMNIEKLKDNPAKLLILLGLQITFGMLVIFNVDQEFFMKIEIMKLLFLSAGVSLPFPLILLLLHIFTHLELKSSDVNTSAGESMEIDKFAGTCMVLTLPMLLIAVVLEYFFHLSVTQLSIFAAIYMVLPSFIAVLASKPSTSQNQ